MYNVIKRTIKIEEKYLRLIFHFLFWMMMYQFFIYIKKPLLGLPYGKTALVELKDLFTIGIIFYLLSYYILPITLKKRQYLLLAVYLILIYYLYAFSAYLEFMVLPEFISIPGRGYLAFGQRIIASGIGGILLLENVAEILLDLSYLLSPALIIKLFISLINLNAQTIKLERDNLNLELAFLKAQINPHFLFNTLNNVYSLALHKSDATADVVLRLSDLMRYTLYDSNTSYISLAKELQFCKNYIELERIRHSNRVAITSEIVYEEQENLMIAPLIIFTFIENAFKHGINVSVGQSWVNIKIIAKSSRLNLEIVNSKFIHKSTVKQLGGIGIVNTNKRLKLLYPDRFTLNVKEDENSYAVDLQLILK